MSEQGKVVAEKPKAVPQAINNLQKSVEMVGQSVARLADDLTGVLVAEPPSPTADVEAEVTHNLAGKLHAMVGRTEEILGQVDSLRSRLEL